MTDRIFLAGYRRQVEIGVLEEERGATQALRFDVTLEVAGPASGDEIGSVVSYVDLVDAVEAVAAGPRLNLVETFAEAVARHCLDRPGARRVTVRIAKLDRLEAGAELGVEIVRPA